MIKNYITVLIKRRRRRDDKLVYKNESNFRAHIQSVFSMRFLIFTSLLIFSTVAENARFDNYQVYTVSIENEEQLKALKYLDEHSDAVRRYIK